MTQSRNFYWNAFSLTSQSIGEEIHAYWMLNLITGESWKRERIKINFIKLHWKSNWVSGTSQSIKTLGG